jgi:hypothetical protein
MIEEPYAGLDEALLQRLRELARRGYSASQLVKELHAECSEGRMPTLSVLLYFTRAFGLKLMDARMLEAAPCMGGAAFTDLEVNQLLDPLIASGGRASGEKQTDES